MDSLVSIIMPAYNAERSINTAIDSVIDQTYENWELLIINDGSTDNTDNIINEYSDPRIRIFSQTNMGVSTARNTGLKNMKGDYFCFLDADDSMPPDSIKCRVNYLSQKQDINFLDGSILIYDKNLRVVTGEWVPSYKSNPSGKLLSLSDSCYFGLTWMIRRDKNTEYQFHPDLTHGEDLLFFIELSLAGGKYDFVENVILHYRKGHASAMRDLRGLETGYHYIYRYITNNNYVTTQQAVHFKKKARSIILKSYLGNFCFYQGLRFFFKNW